MADEETSARIAVVGMGPRGLGALEALAARMQGTEQALSVDVFDPFPASGAGPNFDPDESPLCLLNIPMRDISIRPPAFTHNGSFAEWLADAPDPDTFPTRADLGRYLEDRYADLRDLGTLKIARKSLSVEALKNADGGWLLHANNRWQGPYAEVLLTLGQPSVVPDDQLAEWQSHARQSSGILAQAYPARDLERSAADWAGKTVAIRGLGLSAFDVLRVLTVAQGGRFEDGGYIASGREPARILPFSLDGKPPFPKPETSALDDRFEPSEEETSEFSDAIARAAKGDAETAKRRITDALAPAATRMLRQQGVSASMDDVVQWLKREWDEPGSQESGGPRETLRFGIGMATGSILPTIGYTVGQIWRKWQDEIRSGYNPAQTPPKTAKVLIDFDEGLKRYSYGPPARSSRELVALIEAGIVDLGLSADPTIDLTAEGWTLDGGDHSTQVSVMIDSVLPSPDLSAITAPLVSQMLDEGRLCALAEGLAANTSADGQVICKDGEIEHGLSLLGRLALGSVIAADSLHDCFGEAANRWADGVVSRMV